MSAGIGYLIGYGILAFFAGHTVGVVWSATQNLIEGVTGSRFEE